MTGSNPSKKERFGPFIREFIAIGGVITDVQVGALGNGTVKRILAGDKKLEINRKLRDSCGIMGERIMTTRHSQRICGRSIHLPLNPLAFDFSIQLDDMSIHKMSEAIHWSVAHLRKDYLSNECGAPLMQPGGTDYSTIFYAAIDFADWGSKRVDRIWRQWNAIALMLSDPLKGPGRDFEIQNFQSDVAHALSVILRITNLILGELVGRCSRSESCGREFIAALKSGLSSDSGLPPIDIAYSIAFNQARMGWEDLTQRLQIGIIDVLDDYYPWIKADLDRIEGRDAPFLHTFPLNKEEGGTQ